MAADLKGMLPRELVGFCAAQGQPPYRARQLFSWLHRHGARTFEEMTPLPRQFRARLAEVATTGALPVLAAQRDPGDGTCKYLLRLPDGQTVETVRMAYRYGFSACVSSQVGCRQGCRFCASTLGGLIRNLTAGEMIEQLVALNRDLAAGPAVAAGPSGWARARGPAATRNGQARPAQERGEPGAGLDLDPDNPDAGADPAADPEEFGADPWADPYADPDEEPEPAGDGEHGDGPAAADRRSGPGAAAGDPPAAPRRIARVVVMGMGEPLENLPAVLRFLHLAHDPEGCAIGWRHLTVSTSGLVPGIDALAAENLPITLAISLHAPNDEVRNHLMPINRRHPLAELIPACWRYLEATGRRLTFEYVMIDGVNDLPEHARELAKLLRGLRCHVNLIPLNPVAGRDLRCSRPQAMAAFRRILSEAGLPATVRRQLGTSIDAACGQLRRRLAPLAGTPG